MMVFRKTKEIQSDEVVCPYCYHGSFTRKYNQYRWVCDNCNRQFTISKGKLGRIKYTIKGIRKP